jgi:hypothetical protein
MAAATVGMPGRVFERRRKIGSTKGAAERLFESDVTMIFYRFI